MEVDDVLSGEGVPRGSKAEVRDRDPNGVMAPSSTVGSVNVSLHPLVIMNMAEHWTRTRAQNEGKAEQVIGAIIGQHKGRHLEIMNSFELAFTMVDGLVVIDKDYYRTKEEQFKQVFSEMDFLGWYTTGDLPTPSDIHVHKQITEIYESPVLLKLNPLAKTSDLPIAVYESVIDIINSEATMLFVQLPYVLATEEAERIGVDHVARMSTAENMETSLVAEHLLSQHSAIKMLHSRVKLILEYVKAAQRGEAPVSHDALRLAHSLCHRLPAVQPERFKHDFFQQCCDTSLITYLGMITKGCEEVHQFVTRFNMLNEKHTVARRMRAGLYDKRIRMLSDNFHSSSFNPRLPPHRIDRGGDNSIRTRLQKAEAAAKAAAALAVAAVSSSGSPGGRPPPSTATSTSTSSNSRQNNGSTDDIGGSSMVIDIDD